MEQKVLEVSCIGYTTQNISVGSSSKYDVVLSEDTLMLAETVVVGYGTMKKGEVASAISTVKSGDFLKTPGANAAELIKGKVPGLIVNTPDGNPCLQHSDLPSWSHYPQGRDGASCAH